VNAVGLNSAGDGDEILVDHRHKGDVVVRGERAEELLEGLDVVGSVVGRQRDAGEQDFNVRGFERGEDLIEIAAGLSERKAAKTVVAAEFDDHDFRMLGEKGGKARDCVFSGGAAGAAVDHSVVVALGVEILLQGTGIRLAEFQALPGGDAVSVTDEDVSAGGRDGLNQEREKGE